MADQKLRPPADAWEEALERLIPADASLTVIKDTRNDLLLYLDFLTWHGLSDGFTEQVERITKKLIEVSYALSAKRGEDERKEWKMSYPAPLALDPKVHHALAALDIPDP